MTALVACDHPEEAREPLPYDGRWPADPDDWRCADCGAVGMRLDRRSYAERVEAERLFQEFEERHAPLFETRDLRTREGDVTVPVLLPPADYFNETAADILDKIYRASGVPPVLTQAVDKIDVTSIFDSFQQAVSVSRERAIEGGFDPARPDSDLTATIYAMRSAGSLVLKRVDHVEFAHDLFARSLRMVDEIVSQSSWHSYLQTGRIMGWPLERKNLVDPFGFRVVGS